MLTVRNKPVWLIAVFIVITSIILLSVFFTGGFSYPEEIKTDNLSKYKAAVVTNGHECAHIGGNILRKGGSAADAAIASLFCEGVSMPESMGLGGGFLLTIYTKATGQVETLISRETAPAAARINMFADDPNLAQKGGLSVAVPGELRGYWELHQKYGKLNWADLVQPTIDLCRNGHLITEYLENKFKTKEDDLLNEPTLREIFIDPTTNETWKEGHILKRLKLAETLEIIAKEGADALYNGSLTKSFVKDIQDNAGIITEEDMQNYRPIWSAPVYTQLEDNITVYTSSLPGSGVILDFILNILDGQLDRSNNNPLVNWQKIIESFKFGFAHRMDLGDPDFEPGMKELINMLLSKSYSEEIRKSIRTYMTSDDPSDYRAKSASTGDHGTAHVSVLASNGDAVSVTSTINLVFGSLLRSKSTGIILNDQMDDFSTPNMSNAYNLPPSSANFIKPGKRPLSSMCPSIILDKNGDVRMIIGAAGGSKIITSVATVIIRNIWYGESLYKSINDKRLHHQLLPMEIEYEEDFNQGLVKDLTEIGHQGKIIESSLGFSAVTGITRENGTIFGQYDLRRQGSVDLF